MSGTFEEGGKLTAKGKDKVKKTVEEWIIIDSCWGLRGRKPDIFVLRAEGGFVEPGEESVDVFKVHM